MKRLYSLDALRGLAALSVVLWHWQHFYCLTGDWQDGWRRENEPFYALLKPFYLQGWAAVDLFFALSGFVFFWLYAEKIAARRVRAWPFALKRLSRLYPLHLATLLAVAGLQMLFYHQTERHFLFPADSWGRLASNLTLLQVWIPPDGVQSFNGPAWTVSIEAGMYVLFFALCRRGVTGARAALLISLSGILLLDWNFFIARGVMGFFLGGAVYYAVARLRISSHARAWSRGLTITAFAGWGAALAGVAYDPLHAGILKAATWLFSFCGPLDCEDYGSFFLVLYIYTLIPPTILALALRESLGAGDAPPPIAQGLARLGDISYSTYMLHFPLQLVCVLAALHFGLGTDLFERPSILIGFYAVLIGLGAVSWRYFERPTQNLLRRLTENSPQRLR